MSEDKFVQNRKISLKNLNLKQLHIIKVYTMPFVLVLLIFIFSLTSSRFLSLNNLFVILNNASVTGIIAIGMTFILILGGIDLSVSSVVTIVTVILGFFLVDYPVHLSVAIIIGLMVGAVIGLLNGILVVKIRIPAIIVTLGTASIVQSIASFVTQGAIQSLGEFQVLTYVGQGKLFGLIPIPVIFFIVLTIVGAIILNKTKYGTYVRAIGGIDKASRLMGLNVEGYKISVYVLCGLFAAIAGIIVAGRLSMASSQTGKGLELPAIAAAVLGGSSLSGGEGTVVGTLVGALILSVVFNALIILGVPFFYQLIVTGGVLIIAVAFNETIRKLT